MTQDIIVYSLVGVAVIYLVYRFRRKTKKDEKCDDCGHN
jgi:uncharacterized membrane protein YuzA (DUF378 family)